MKPNRLSSWMQKVYHTQDEEISCSECFRLVSRYVEVELSGEDPTESMPQVKQHLEQCAACNEEYETLRDIQRLDNEGGAPSLDDLRNSIK